MPRLFTRAALTAFFLHEALAAANMAVLGAANMVPNYEIHLLLDPTVCLGSDFKLTSAVLSTFAMPETVTKMNVQFLDTDAKDIYNQGWSPRIRNMEDDDGFELTYKKRYSVSNGDINSALTQAKNDGFDITMTNYEAQIEWSYTSQTLSISRDKSVSDSGYDDMELPGKKHSRTMLINNQPGKFKNWLSSDWGTNELGNSRIYGPVLAKRSIGTWDGDKLYIEVWPIKDSTGTGNQYIVEASFKTTNATYASTGHDDLMALLQSKGWFLAQNSLKTGLIMANY